ncbi:hypothetical protein [Pseudoalteromonas denitrificans]|uniref:Uncharacterized protein n=1 Tax=Pseudoalteromonas denitrificans DSM 6059 TaxID=1123010 RepID=A0A1I1LSP6_9GAMM|nr:hypothetical protein [Pseudoalteromonas denitrificans]SFC75532.1 hypothetical protein SAMN02745724_02471 [Pseudoalteromonas denitrificans DSM 6059]
MSLSFRITFASLSNELTEIQAIDILQTKLKLNANVAQKFLQGGEVFNPISQEKALKQQKIFASMGIKVKITDISANNSPQEKNPTNLISQAEKDAKIISALDYITTSLIRLEEKVDELSQNTSEQLPSLDDENELSEQPEPLDFDEDFGLPIKKRQSRLFLVIVSSILVILLIALGISLTYPELLKP